MVQPIGEACRPLVSIIVPNYNHARFLPERLASIRSQTFQDYELIILDDASSDDSLDVISRHLAGVPHQLLINQINSGSPCSQWLKGIQQACGHYIWIAESDDSCSADFLEKMVDLLNEGAELAYCRSQAIDASGERLPQVIYWPETVTRSRWVEALTLSADHFCRKYMLSANCIPNASCVVFNREAALACLDLKDILKKKLFTGDWLFWIYFLSHSGGMVAYSPDELSLFRHHDGATRSVASLRTSDQRRFREYSDAVTWILQQQLSPGRIPWLRHTLGRDWEWMLVEYLWRLNPTMGERFTGCWLSGILRWSLPIRLFSSRNLRRLFFVRSFA